MENTDSPSRTRITSGAKPISCYSIPRRPLLEQVKRRLMRLNPRFELTGGEADEAGKFESFTMRSPQDYAAMDISYVSGEEVSEQVDELQRELKGNVDAADRPKFTQLSECDAKFDILHFEQVSADDDGDDERNARSQRACSA